jgi:glycosyltransferase involved in cell wall biosynthesis
VIEKPDGGGLGNYLNRMTLLLTKAGHDVEIFVIRHKLETPRIIDFNGIRVEHMPLAKNWYFRIVNFMDRLLFQTPYSGLHYNLGVSLALSRALEKRHNEKSFDIVQSANVSGAGLFIKRKKGRKHILRLSSIIKPNLINDNQYKGIGARILVLIEKLMIIRADKIYAPSFFTAKNYKFLFSPKIHMLRPPFFLEAEPDNDFNQNIPDKYLIHFGSIGTLKGSDLIAQALVKIWEQIPDFKMVWVGKERVGGEMNEYHRIWGDFSKNIIWIPSLQKKELYAVLKKSTAAVLPSRVDNLPNTVIESLFLNVPVIGSDGASIDELVKEGLNGALIKIGDVNHLAELMIKAWVNLKLILPDKFQLVPEMEHFNESNSINNFIDFIKN